MKILVTGGNGQIAWEIQHQHLNFPQFNIVALNHSQLDIADRYSIEDALARYSPQLVINTAAYTAVDKAENDPDVAFAINGEAAGLLAQCCAVRKIPIIHLSTDYVFDGCLNRAYHEQDTTNPLSIYGDSKWQGELLVRRYCPEHIILRVSGVFGVHGNNFVKTILRLAKEKEELQVVADQVTCPTPATDIAVVILQIAAQLSAQTAWGIYHYCAAEPVSWHGFAEEIMKEAQQYPMALKVKNIIPISSSEYNSPVQRPAYAVLDCHKIAKKFKITQQSWRLGLQHVVRCLHEVGDKRESVMQT